MATAVWWADYELPQALPEKGLLRLIMEYRGPGTRRQPLQQGECQRK